MNKKYSILLGIGALVIMVALNVGHAVDKYGIVKGNLSIHVLAQGSSSSGDGDSPGGSSSSSESSDEHPNGIAPPGYGQACWDQDNNHNGRNPYLYCNKDGSPKDCIIYKHVDAQGNVEWSETNASGGVGVIVIKCEGKKENCPNKGYICTVYSCHVTTNTN